MSDEITERLTAIERKKIEFFEYVRLRGFRLLSGDPGEVETAADMLNQIVELETLESQMQSG